MTGQDLLIALQVMRERGVDLRALDVVVGYTETDPSVPYDRGVPRQIYPDSIDVLCGELALS